MKGEELKSMAKDPVYRLVHGGHEVYSGIDPNEYEKIIYGWNNDNKIFLDLIEDINPRYILELGSWLGSSAIHMGRFIKDKGLDTKIVCVDTWLGSREFVGKNFPGDRSKLVKNGLSTAYPHFLANIKREGLEEVVMPLPQTSSNALRFLSGEGVRFEMVYIDGSNQYEDIVSDMNLSWNVLANDGVMFGDNYTNFSYPQVTAAVNSFVYGNRIRDQFSVDSYKNFWFIKKKELL